MGLFKNNRNFTVGSFKSNRNFTVGFFENNRNFTVEFFRNHRNFTVGFFKKPPFISGLEHRGIFVNTTVVFVADYHGGKHGGIRFVPTVGYLTLPWRGSKNFFLWYFPYFFLYISLLCLQTYLTLNAIVIFSCLFCYLCAKHFIHQSISYTPVSYTHLTLPTIYSV